jgi:hypothetical protein
LRVAFKGTGRRFSHGFVLGIIGIAVRMIEGTLHLNALWIGARGAAWRENVSWSWSSRHWRFKSNWLFRVGYGSSPTAWVDHASSDHEFPGSAKRRLCFHCVARHSVGGSAQQAVIRLAEASVGTSAIAPSRLTIRTAAVGCRFRAGRHRNSV